MISKKLNELCSGNARIYSLLVFVSVLCALLTACAIRDEAQFPATNTSFSTRETSPPDSLATESPVPPTKIMSTESLPTLTVTPAPTALPTEERDLSFRITFATYKESGNRTKGTVAYVDPPFANPTVVYSSSLELPEFGIAISKSYAWSHDFQKLALEHRNDSEGVSISIIDLAAEETSNILASNSANDRIMVDSYSWSIDDRYFISEIFDGYASTSIITDLQTNTSMQLNYQFQEELLGWSPVDGDQYVKISRPDFPDFGGDILTLNQVYRSTPLITLSDFDAETLLSNVFSWSPDGTLIIVGAQTESGLFSHYLIDLTTNQHVSLLPGFRVPVSRLWSPNNRWVIFYRFDDGIYLLDVGSPEEVLAVPNSSSATLINWLPDSSQFIYLLDNRIYSVSPLAPDSPVLLDDLSDILDSLGPHFRIDLLP